MTVKKQKEKDREVQEKIHNTCDWINESRGEGKGNAGEDQKLTERTFACCFVLFSVKRRQVELVLLPVAWLPECPWKKRLHWSPENFNWGHKFVTHARKFDTHKMWVPLRFMSDFSHLGTLAQAWPKSPDERILASQPSSLANTFVEQKWPHSQVKFDVKISPIATGRVRDGFKHYHTRFIKDCDGDRW